MNSIWQSLEASSVGGFIAESAWAFPTIETLHVLAIATVVGSIAIMDLRLLGLASMDSRVTTVSRDTLRWTWIAFGIAAVTGLLLFVSKATAYTVNPYFLWKMALLVLAGVNMAFFHLFTWRSVAGWDSTVAVPASAKLAGALSLIFWVLVVFCGRVVGFTLGVYV